MCSGVKTGGVDLSVWVRRLTPVAVAQVAVAPLAGCAHPQTRGQLPGGVSAVAERG